MKANSKEWWLILFGLLGSFVLGVTNPLFAVLFGEVLKAFAKPIDEILNALHPFAALFIAVGVVSGIAVFLKVFFFTFNMFNFMLLFFSFLYSVCLFHDCW